MELLLSTLGVDLPPPDLDQAIVQMLEEQGESTGRVPLALFHTWWKGHGNDINRASATSIPPELVEAIHAHPSGNPLRNLLLVKEMLAEVGEGGEAVRVDVRVLGAAEVGEHRRIRPRAVASDRAVSFGVRM